MATIEIINKKINELKESIKKLEDTQVQSKDQLEVQIQTIKESLTILENEDKMINYDFTKVLDILKSYDYTIENIDKILNDIKVSYQVKKDLELSEISLAPNQEDTLNNLKDNLKVVENSLQLKLNELSQESKEELEKKLQDLETLKSILEGNGRRKYVTKGILQSFYESFDWNEMSRQETKDILKGLFETQNFNSKIPQELVDFEDVIELYKEFVPSTEFIENSPNSFLALLKKYENEVRANINLDSAREILQFFKEQGIINNFRKGTILMISLYGDINYVKELYEDIITNRPEQLEEYYENDSANMWVNSKESKPKRRPFGVIRGKSHDRREERKSLYAECHKVTDEEYRENVRILEEFLKNYEIEECGSHLRAKTTGKIDQSLLRLVVGKKFGKTAGLCQVFEFGKIGTYSIPKSLFISGDIEDKIHLAIELGLLNPPMTAYYKEIEKDIPRYGEFNVNASKKGLHNQSIRNYLQRSMSYIAKFSIEMYIYMKYKLETEGPAYFYQNFFSSAKAGQKSDSFITSQDERTMKSKDDMKDIVSATFQNDLYEDFIENYAQYDEDIYSYNEKGQEVNDAIENLDDNEQIDFVKSNEYFDVNILNHPLIQHLEDKYCVNDILMQNNVEISIKNEYVYMFGHTIISRYKVLHNASILYKKYGRLTEDMIFTSIVRNSYISQETFEMILDMFNERGRN